MHKEITDETHYVRAVVVFVACLLATLLGPFLGLLLNLSLLFFAPQLLFPYEGFVAHAAGDTRAVFGHRTAMVLDFIQWGLAIAVFTWLARRMSVGRAFLAAIVMIVIVGIITNVGFGLFGISVELDGP